MEGNCVTLFILNYITSKQIRHWKQFLSWMTAAGFFVLFCFFLCSVCIYDKLKGSELTIIIWLNGALQIFIIPLPLKKGSIVSNIVIS